MFIALTTLLGLGGLALLGVGVTGFVRRRWQARRARLGGAARPRWPFTVAMVAGGLVLLGPDVLAGLLVGDEPTAPSAGWQALALVYRLLVILWLGVVGVWLYMTRNRFVDAVVSVRDRALRAVHSRTNHELRAVRRTEVGRGMPRDLATLVRYEVSMGERLLRYQRDPEAGYNRPAMVDLGDPVTVAAWEAMFRAEGLRPTRPVATGRDALASDYGRAVIALANAVVAAERHAESLVRSGISDDERAVLHDADRVLEFVRQHATSPGERSAAYDALIARLQTLRSTTQTTPAHDVAKSQSVPDAAPSAGPAATSPGVDGAASAQRAHPWLEVTDRAGAP